MKPAQVNVLFAFFCYGGNGGIRSVSHELIGWWGDVRMALHDDERIDKFGLIYPGDIPLTMERNRVVAEAKRKGFDMVVMIDSDNIPDLYFGRDDHSQPFWQSSFDFAYRRMVQGLPSVVCAPYCGPPPHPINGGEENVYVFQWQSDRCDDPRPGMRITQYERNHAAIMRGIQPIAAGPTGCILYTLDAFDVMPIRKESDEEILANVASGALSVEDAKRRLNMQSWFFYEYPDREQTSKASTEDVTNLREISMAGYAQYGTDLVFCNWDAWAGHAKPKIVGRPQPLRLEHVSAVYQEAVRNAIPSNATVVDLDIEDEDWAEEWVPPEEVEETTPDDAVRQPHTITKRHVHGRPMTLVDGQWFSDEEAQELRDIIAKHGLSDGRVMAINCWAGESVAVISAAIPDATVYCTEPAWKTDPVVRSAWAENVAHLPASKIRSTAIELIDSLPNQDIDLALVMQQGDEESDVASLKLAYRHLRNNGLLVFPSSSMDMLSDGLKQVVAGYPDGKLCVLQKRNAILRRPEMEGVA